MNAFMDVLIAAFGVFLIGFCLGALLLVALGLATALFGEGEDDG